MIKLQGRAGNCSAFVRQSSNYKVLKVFQAERVFQPCFIFENEPKLDNLTIFLSHINLGVLLINTTTDQGMHAGYFPNFLLPLSYFFWRIKSWNHSALAERLARRYPKVYSADVPNHPKV